MDVESYFADALELGDAYWELSLAEDEKEKEGIREYIKHLPYIKNIRSFQKLPSVERGNKWVSVMRGDYFFNPAVPYVREDNEPGTTFASGYHTHDYYELIFVFRGSYRQFVNGTCYEHEQGQVCLLMPETLHREELQKREDRILFTGISKAFFENELCSRINKQFLEVLHPKKNNQFSHQFFTFSIEENRKIQSLLFHIMEEDKFKEAGHHMVISGYLIRLMKELCSSDWNCFDQSRMETEDRLIKEILFYMEEHLETVTKNELGEYFHFHPDYLGRFLLRKTGNTYRENLNNMRMERAVRLLCAGESVNSVIQKLGFSNKGHFNKMFKNFYGMLPGEYKNQKLK